MNWQVAILMCAVGIAVLFFVNRNKAVQTSNALWLPVIWMWLVGSRSLSQWFGVGPGNLNGTLEGSPLDAAVFGLLVAMGAIVLLRRRRYTRAYLAVMTPIVAYSVYCLMSVVWAPYPVPALKRWVKDVGDVVMVLIICTDPRPLEACRRLFSRVGFILLPFSMVLIRFTTLGRTWNNDGLLAIVGVTDNKNTLGLITFVISLGVLWNIRWLLSNRGEQNRSGRLVAQGILLTCGLSLLLMAHSSTSLACFLLGSGLMVATHLRTVRCQPSRVRWLCIATLAAGVLATVFGGAGDVANALGRDTTFSGRTNIWAALMPAVSNPIIGVGFDSFWTSPDARIFHSNLNRQHWYHAEQINEAHNGYIEVYLNLGWIGACLIVVILTIGLWRASRACQINPEIGSLMLAYIVTGTFYSITEAGFRTLNPMWIFILLAVVSASGVNARLFGEEPVKRSRVRTAAAEIAWAGRASRA